MTRFRLPRLFVGVMFFALPVSAAAPISGEDRQYELFTELDTEITDLFTKLVWERPRAYPPATGLAAAQMRCTNAGKRLPTAKELLTLVDEEPHDEYEGSRLVVKMIDRPAFFRTPSDLDFWTSSVTKDGRVVVSFETGVTREVNEGATTAYVRCVFSQP